MKFHLVYGGRLSSGTKPKPDEARDIRDKLSPQIERLWDTHHALRTLKTTAWVPGPQALSRYVSSTGSPFYDTSASESWNVETKKRNGFVNLCDPLTVAALPYIPIVRQSLALNCSLDILFLRTGDPGALVTQDGDIDNRIKILLDALKVPNADNATKYPQKESPTHCLMESDSLVQSLDIETDRLLIPKTQDDKEVHLIIEVTVHVLRVGEWNICLI